MLDGLLKPWEKLPESKDVSGMERPYSPRSSLNTKLAFWVIPRGDWYYIVVAPNMDAPAWGITYNVQQSRFGSRNAADALYVMHGGMMMGEMGDLGRIGE